MLAHDTRKKTDFSFSLNGDTRPLANDNMIINDKFKNKVLYVQDKEKHMLV